MDSDFPPGLLAEWQAFFQTHPQPATGICDDVFAGVKFPLQRKRELAGMLALAAAVKPVTVCEIGADKGGTLYHWCCVPEVRRVIACEVRGLPYRALFEQAFPHIDFLWLGSSSYSTETYQRVRDWLGSGTIDMLFIDGDKSYFDRDFALYAPLVRKPGGLILMHDIMDEVTGGAFRACRTFYQWAQLIDTTESVEAISRARAVVPATSDHEHWLRHWRGCSAGCGVIWT